MGGGVRINGARSERWVDGACGVAVPVVADGEGGVGWDWDWTWGLSEAVDRPVRSWAVG